MASGLGPTKYSASKHGSHRGGSRVGASSSGVGYVNIGTLEEVLLENYFLHLSTFRFEQAREICDQEKEGKSRMGQGPNNNWCEFMSILSRVASAETSYFSLSSVEKASLGRKARKEHTLKNIFEVLVMELKKVHEVYKHGKGGIDFSWERKLAELLVHIIEYVSARKEMLDFYLDFDLSKGCHLDYSRLEEFVRKMKERHKDGFQHPQLKPVKFILQKEMNIVSDLLKVQHHISEWQFLPAVLRIQSCMALLTSWLGVIPLDTEGVDRRQVQRSIKSRPYSPSSSAPVPYLYKWWCKFHVSLLSKFSLYFHGVLSEHASVYDMKFLSAQLDMDYLARFSGHVRNSAAVCVCLLFNSNGIPDFKGPKYRLPDSPPLALTGLNSYPFMIRVPHDFNFLHHRANIVSLVMEKTHHLNTSAQHISQYDDNLHCTYHMTQVDERVTLVVLASSRGSKDRDNRITSWISDVALQLRNTHMASLLKIL